MALWLHKYGYIVLCVCIGSVDAFTVKTAMLIELAIKKRSQIYDKVIPNFRLIINLCIITHMSLEKLQSLSDIPLEFLPGS